MVQLPRDFVENQRRVHGAAGIEWLARLPAILDACCQQWRLTLGPPFGPLSYHYVAPGLRDDSLPVVVKACSPTREFDQEAAALRLFDGAGCARLLATDRKRQVLLLERLQPGQLLRALPDDTTRTRIAAGVMRSLWRPVPARHPFPTLAAWGHGFQRLRRRYGGGTGPLPRSLVAEAERLFAALDASTHWRIVLHGDLHHDNILAGGPRGWLAIDPKGVVGDPVYETATFLRNCLPLRLPGDEASAVLARRITIFADELGVEPARIRAWGIAHAVLSAWWSLEEDDRGWEEAIAVAELLRSMPV